MNILLGGDCDNGGGSYWLAQAINKYTEHHARSVRAYQSYLEYPYDVLNPSTADMLDLISWADVIHVRDRLPKAARGLSLRGKGLVATYTGRVFRGEDKSVFAARRRGFVICVSTPDMMAFCKNAKPIWLPNPREPIQQRIRPDVFTISHAPTANPGKQTDLLLMAVAMLNGVSLDIIEGVAYEACIARKSKSHVCFDQLKYGYGNNAIEAWAIGIPAIAGCSKKIYRDAILKECGYIPFTEPRKATDVAVAELIKQLRDEPGFYFDELNRSTQAFFDFHYAPVVAAKAISVYEQALQERKN